jgi:hypothetical protein
MPGHLQRHHSITLDSDDKKSFLAWATSYNVGEKPTDGPLPANHGPPVELVPIHPGFACGVGLCLYAALAKSSIPRHRRIEHRDDPRKREREATVMVQALFAGVGREFFIVDPCLTSSSSDSPYSVLVSSVLPSLPPLDKEVPVQGREIPPFHRVTQWWDMLGSVVDNRESRRDVIALSAVPGRQEHSLCVLPLLCRQYLVEAQQASQKAGYQVRRKLVSEE